MIRSMCKYITKIAVLVSLVAGGLSNSPGVISAQPYSQAKPFELSLSYEYDDSGKVYMDLGIAIEYNRLVFFRKEDLFRAQYRIIMQAFDDDSGRLENGNVWGEVVYSSDYSETRSSGRISETRKKVFLDPGKYKVQVKIEVEGTTIEYRRESRMEIPGEVSGAAFLSEPVFSTPKVSRLGEKPPWGEIRFSLCSTRVSSGFRLNSSGTYADFDSWLRVTCTLSLPLSEEERSEGLVSMKITDRDREIVLYNRKSAPVGDRGASMLCVDINVDSMQIGNYTLRMSAKSPESEKRHEIKKDFTVVLNSASMGKDFDETVELLALIASGEALDFLENASSDRRVEAWNELWDSYAGTPDLNNYGKGEFIENVAYAIKEFSGAVAGWKSDMGRIFIKNGKPERVEERQGGRYGTYYKLWYYYSKGMVYIFSDRFGTGEYRLVSSRPI